MSVPEHPDGLGLLGVTRSQANRKAHDRTHPTGAQQGRTLSVGVTFQPFPAAELKKYDARLDASDAFKKQLGALARQVEPARKSADTPAKPDAVPRWVDLRFAEFLYFEDHKPASVSQANLERFASSAPEWLREMIDPLSPDDARAYLTIVYRLLYPEPNEMPVDHRAPKATAPPSPKAVPNKSGGNAF